VNFCHGFSLPESNDRFSFFFALLSLLALVNLSVFFGDKEGIEKRKEQIFMELIINHKTIQLELYCRA